MQDKDIAKMRGKVFSVNNKSRWRQLIEKQIAGDEKFSQLQELKISNTELRVLRFETNGSLKESISFPTFNYIEVSKQNWEESDFYNLLSDKRFLFAFFQKNKTGNYKFKGWHFWRYPPEKLHEAQKVWETTKSRILAKNYKFPKSTESEYCHVRPHATDSNDRMRAPDGSWQKKYCFWLNNKLIAKELAGYLK